MRGYDHREALARIWDLVRRTNAYVDERAPWHLAKADDAASQAALDTTLHHLVGAVRQLGRLLHPFLPHAGETIAQNLGTELGKTPDAEHWLDDLTGAQVIKSAALFPRIDVAPKP